MNKPKCAICTEDIIGNEYLCLNCFNTTNDLINSYKATVKNINADIEHFESLTKKALTHRIKALEKELSEANESIDFLHENAS